MSIQILDSLIDLLKDEYAQDKMEDMARLIYSNGTVTINLLAAAAAVALGLLLLIPLLSLLFQPSAGGAAVSSGYGAPSVSYGAPEESYGAPAPAYGAPGYSRNDDIYSEARSFYNEITDNSDADYDGVQDITKRFGSVGPVMSALGNAAAKLLE